MMAAMGKPDDKPGCSEGVLDPEQRRREKQASRDEDERALAAGEITEEELGRRNFMFSALDPADAKIVSYRAKIRIKR